MRLLSKHGIDLDQFHIFCRIFYINLDQFHSAFTQV